MMEHTIIVRSVTSGCLGVVARTLIPQVYILDVHVGDILERALAYVFWCDIQSTEHTILVRRPTEILTH